MNQPKKRPVRRLVRGLATLIAVGLLYTVVGGYAPFAAVEKLPVDLDAVDETVRRVSEDIPSDDRATLLESRTQALDERIRLINQAREEIVIASYDCRDGESTRDILCAALRKADEGVRVRLLSDGLHGALRFPVSDLFRAVAAHPNVEIRLYNPPSALRPWAHMSRMHDKYVIVDDFGYILGGRNMFDYFIGEYPAACHSLDREALVYNAAHGTQAGRKSSLFQVREYFESVWNGAHTVAFDPGVSIDRARAVCAELEARCQSLREEKPELFAEWDYAAGTCPTRGVWLLNNSTDVGAKSPELFHTLCALMERAGESVIIHSPYAVLNDMMAERLRAVSAKVPVTLMVNAVENGQNLVASSDYFYHRRQVLDTGVKLLEYLGGESYHGKAIAIDGDISIIGSFNLDLRSAYVDTELMLLIRGEEVNAMLRANMEALHADCRRVADESDIDESGVTVPRLPLWKRALFRVAGGLLQLVRNLL